MNAPDDRIQTDDRRKSDRQAAQNEVRMLLETTDLAGPAENISSTGVMFFSDEQLRVSVEIDENGTTTQRSGRLVRAQRMQGDSVAWAVEFDRD